MDKLNLVTIQLEDLEWVRDLRNENRQYFMDDKYITPEDHYSWYMFKCPDEFFIIKLGEKPIGTISLIPFQDHTEVGNIIIDKSYRRKGILKKLINKINKAYKPLHLTVRADNKLAVEIYEKLGFKVVSYRMHKI
jgi:ribosomal protein S18 acetylase RimI-like enzyme